MIIYISNQNNHGMGPTQKNHYTHARGEYLDVHIGVYQAQSITPFQKFER